MALAYQNVGGDNDNNDDNNQSMNLSGGAMFAMLLLFYWTHQTISNVVHCTVAGTVGTWWFHPASASSFCSQGVTSSLNRSVTYSLGSITLGSLIVALVQTLRALVEQIRHHSDDGILICIADCLLGMIQGLVEYFNKWAFVYVGLYGYSYMEAGKNVMALFRARGWSAIVNDDLVSNVLSFLALSIGALTGGIGVVAAAAVPQIANQDGALYAVFFFGLIVGFMFSSIMFSVVLSAVDTIVVCYCEAPLDFQMNYPELYDAMTEAWMKIYPACWNPEEMENTEVGGEKKARDQGSPV
jgi:hypothetical protein